MKKTWLICLVLASFVCGCQSKKESNAVLFEKFLDKNVASFAKVMAESGVDTIQAKKYCFQPGLSRPFKSAFSICVTPPKVLRMKEG